MFSSENTILNINTEISQPPDGWRIPSCSRRTALYHEPHVEPSEYVMIGSETATDAVKRPSPTPACTSSSGSSQRSARELRAVETVPRQPRLPLTAEMDWYGAPGGEVRQGRQGTRRPVPGSDVDVVAGHLFGGDRGVDIAKVATRMTCGIMPDPPPRHRDRQHRTTT